MEALCTEGKIKYLGVSNADLEQLQELYHEATIKPHFVQNRCFAQQGWDKEVRTFCKEKGIIYQGFSLLTANSFVLPQLTTIGNRYNKTPSQVIFRFSQQIGMVPLSGTTNEQHMKEDLSLDFTLTNEELTFIENIAL